MSISYNIDIEVPYKNLIFPVNINSEYDSADILEIIANLYDCILENSFQIFDIEGLKKSDILLIEKRDYLNKKLEFEKNLNKIIIINFKNNFKNLKIDKKKAMNLIYKKIYPLKIENEDRNLEIIQELKIENEYSYIYLTPNNNNFSFDSNLKINKIDDLLEKNIKNEKKEKKEKNKKEKKYIFTQFYNRKVKEVIDPKNFKWFETFKNDNKNKDFAKYIITNNYSISKLSFCYGEKRKNLWEDKSCPAPVLFTNKELENIFVNDLIKKYKGISVCEKTGLLVTLDKELINKQKGFLLEILKKLSKSIFNKNIKFSLPVKLFETKSVCQRIPEICSYIYYIKNETDDLTRIKNFLKFFLGGIHVTPNQKKPFNPYLGETFQGNINGIYNIYSEHIIHEPPITIFNIEGPDFSFSSKIEVFGKPGMKPNVYFKGLMIMEYKNKKRIIASFPILQINGLVFGSKSTQYIGNIFICDITSNYRVNIKLQDKNLANDFKGVVFKPDEDILNEKYSINKPITEIYSNDNNNELSENLSPKQFIYKKDKVLNNIEGNLYNNLIFDDSKIWDRSINKPLPYYCNDDCLPSDSRYREDLIFLYYDKIPIADEWKNKLEERQRLDRAPKPQNPKTPNIK